MNVIGIPASLVLRPLLAVFGCALLGGMAGTSYGDGIAAEVKEQAASRLDFLGLPKTGEMFVRCIAAAHRPVIDLFLASGIDVNEPGRGKCPPLLAAVLSRDFDLARSLIDAGADVGGADENGVTPLMAASYSGHVPTIEALTSRGAALDAADGSDRTALHYALAGKQLPVVEYFTRATEKEPGLVRNSQQLAELAFATGDRHVIDGMLALMPEKAAWFPAARVVFNEAIKSSDSAVIAKLIGKFSGPAAPSETSQPWLAYAVASEDGALLSTLLEAGENPNATLDRPGDTALRDTVRANFMRSYVEQEPGMTPLMLAAGLGNADAVKALLAAGANRNASTRGKSALIALYFAGWAKSPESIQLLLGNSPPRSETRIEISLAAQRATFFKAGHPYIETEISTGRSGFDTKPGEYVITDKHLTHRSTMYPADMPYFMRLSCQAFGLHEGYVTGRPASHGCVRLPRDAARELFKEAPVGTWVSITK
jgi:ankyrin repeat protein